MDTSLIYRDNRLEAAIRNHIKEDLDDTCSGERALQVKVDLKIQSILKWGSQCALSFGNGFSAIVRPCHSPLLLLNFIRLYVEERVHLIFQTDRNTTGLAKNYDRYMVALSNIYYSTDRDQFEQNKRICMDFVGVINKTIQDLCLDEEFDIPVQASVFISELLSDLHRLDLTVSRIVNGSILGKSTKGKQASTHIITIQFNDLLQACRELVKHSNHTIDWLISFFTQKIKQMSKDIYSPEPGLPTLSYENAQKGLGFIHSLVSLTINLKQDLEYSTVNFSQVNLTFKQMDQSVKNIHEYFRYCDSTTEQYRKLVQQQQKICDRNPTNENKNKLQKTEKIFAFFDTYQTLHMVFVTHFTATHDNLKDLFKSWEGKENQSPGWTAQLSSNLAKQCLTTEPKQVKTVLDQDRGLVTNRKVHKQQRSVKANVMFNLT